MVEEAPSLTPRERQIWRLLAQGKSNKAIAYQLDLSLNTVKTYIHRLYRKLRVACRTQAVAAYYRHHENHDEARENKGVPSP